jgi:hypothetical protein
MKIIYIEHTGVKLMEVAEQTGNYRNYLSLNTNCEIFYHLDKTLSK